MAFAIQILGTVSGLKGKPIKQYMLHFKEVTIYSSRQHTEPKSQSLELYVSGQRYHNVDCGPVVTWSKGLRDTGLVLTQRKSGANCGLGQ